MSNLGKIKNIHFIGIGGSGMIGIAKLLLMKGYKISGSDIEKSNALINLSKQGAEVFYKHKRSNIKNVDLVVISSAISSNNIELDEAKTKNITVIPRAEMLGSIMKGYRSISVAGSHGKTTTTSLIAGIFSDAGLSPTYVVGGKVLSVNENSKLGLGSYMITEADESDGTFHYLDSDVAVITNIDNDHLTFYKNSFESLKDAFKKFMEQVPFYGYCILNYDDKNLRKLAKNLSRKTITFGKSRYADFQIFNIRYENSIQKFDLLNQLEGKKYSLSIKVPGDHNIYNATAAAIVSLEEGISESKIKKSLINFVGVSRRYEKHKLKIDNKEKILIDDYGHHPVEIKSTLDTIKQEYPKKKVCMVFQPHRFSRTAQLFDDFIKVLSKQTNLILMDIYPASEKPIKDINSSTIIYTLRQKSFGSVQKENNINKIINYIDKNSNDFDIILVQGAGSIATLSNSIINKWKK